MPEPQSGEWVQTAVQILGGAAGGGALAKAFEWITGRRRAAAEVRKIDAESAKALGDVVDEHLKALLEGYESRITDLTNEVTSLRAEVKALRKALDARPKPPDSITAI